MRGWAVLPTAWAACALPPVVEAEPSEAATIAEVWDGLQGTLLLEAVIADRGVLAELRSWTPPDPAWPAWRPRWEPPPVAPDSVEGRPIWDPPAAIRDAREAGGVEAYEHKFELTAAAG